MWKVQEAHELSVLIQLLIYVELNLLGKVLNTVP
jgi:hypothetical protein